VEPGTGEQKNESGVGERAVIAPDEQTQEMIICLSSYQSHPAIRT
jgi:hypothetical protein